MIGDFRVSEDAVRWAYRLILGREPESDEVLLRHCSHKDIASLRQAFLNSDEFLYSAFEQVAGTVFKTKQIDCILKTGLVPLSVLDEISLTPSIDMVSALLGTALLKASGARNSVPFFLFVYLDKKDRDSLFPVYDALVDVPNRKFCVEQFSIFDAVNYVIRHRLNNVIFVSALEKTSYLLQLMGLGDMVHVYLEHGVSPLKKYTYAEHYRRFDYSLLPGRLWVERLHELYPDTKGRLFVTGFPKLAKKVVTADDRAAYCNAHNLDSAKVICLFAPSWSGGERHRGIFNIEALEGVPNLIAIPHDGDREFALQLKDFGFPVHVMVDDVITDHYPFADLLITDVSSTAIEFALLGKPVVCLLCPPYPDYDDSWLGTDCIPGIPHTNYRWDFAHVCTVDSVADVVQRVVESDTVINSEVISASCECYGRDASRLAVDALLHIGSTEFAKKGKKAWV